MNRPPSHARLLAFYRSRMGWARAVRASAHAERGRLMARIKATEKERDEALRALRDAVDEIQELRRDRR